MSIDHVTLTDEEAIRELKSAKLQSKDAIAWAQQNAKILVDRDAYIASHRRRIDALHMAIAALGGAK